jgi:hypothetical protein
MAHWSDEYLDQISDCEIRSDRLSDWQLGFIDSLKRQIHDGNMPTLKQIEKLDEAWEQATKKG